MFNNNPYYFSAISWYWYHLNKLHTTSSIFCLLYESRCWISTIHTILFSTYSNINHINHIHFYIGRFDSTPLVKDCTLKWKLLLVNKFIFSAQFGLKRARFSLVFHTCFQFCTKISVLFLKEPIQQPFFHVSSKIVPTWLSWAFQKSPL